MPAKGCKARERSVNSTPMRLFLIAAGLLAAGCTGRPAVTATVQPGTAPGVTPVAAAFDSARAAEFFAEAAQLCGGEGGRLWGVSLCGPMVIADPLTKAIATNRPAPAAPRPAALGYANSAMTWGGTRWTTLVWQHVAGATDEQRRVLLVHELFHRVQPDLGFFLPEPSNDHLDTFAGRYWLQLEWRALAEALRRPRAGGLAALRDELAFRAARHHEFPGAVENERVLVINEGLPQYTGTVVAFADHAQAASSTVEQLAVMARKESYVRTFAYGSGAAYGVLLDAWSPGWTRSLSASDDLALLLMAAAKIDPVALPDADEAAKRYDGEALRSAERRREAELAARVAELRRRFVEGPVLILPKGNSASFATDGMTPIPGEGMIFPRYRTTTAWGSLDGDQVLVGDSLLRVPAPARVEGDTLRGEGWTVDLAEGWVVRPGVRPGDFTVARRQAGTGEE